MPSLRIALLTCSTRPWGGAGPALALAEALARAGQQVTVWVLARDGDTEFFRPIDAAVRVRVVPFPEVADEGAGPQVQRSIAVLAEAFATQVAASDGGGYDVVHAQDWITANAVPGRLRTVHHLDHFTTPELAAGHERALREPCAHVCVSDAVAAELKAKTGKVARVIPNGVESERFAAAAGGDPAAIKKRQEWIDQFGSYVLAVGGIEPRKGTLDLIRAMARVRRRRPGTRLVVAGGDTPFDYRDYRRQVTLLADRLKVEPVVLGPVPHDDLPSLVAAAAVFAFPAVAEGSGLAAMEALAAGVPVVTRDLPEFREVFADTVRFADGGDGGVGVAVDGLSNQVVATLEDADNPFAQSGRRLAARHNWDDAASAHLALYRELLSEGRPVGTADRREVAVEQA